MEWPGRAPAPPAIEAGRGAKDKRYEVLLNGKTALVTGAGSGIGRAIALHGMVAVTGSRGRLSGAIRQGAAALARNMPHDAKCEGNCRAKGYSRTRIVAANDGRHVVAAGIEARDRNAVAPEHAAIPIGSIVTSRLGPSSVGLGGGGRVFFC